MNKIKYLLRKLKEHKEELGLWGVTKWLVFAIRFRFLLFLGRVSDAAREGNIDYDENVPGLVPKVGRPRVFIFAGIPFYDIGGGQRAAQLTRTFNSLGYEVFYLFAHDSSESKIPYMEIPTVLHKNILKYPLKAFVDAVKKNDLVIVEFPDQNFVPYIESARKAKAKVVYENIDDWETSLGNSIFDRESLDKILKCADVLVGTARPLVKQLKRYCKELNIEKTVIYEPNAVDDSLFNIHKKYEKPEDFVAGKKTLLYYGSLWGEWFDWELIAGVAKKFPSYSILLIGEYQNLGAKVGSMPKNVHFLGIKKQADLPAYLYYSDFALVPFKPGKIVESVSPLKIFEYLAMGKPVLCTDMPEVRKFPNVLIGNTVDEWVKLMADFHEVDLDEGQRFVGKNSWYCRCNDILGSTGLIAEECPKEFYKNISIIILNYNNMSCILDCIDSLLRYSKRYKYEIIVVDNGSKDGSYESLIERGYGNKVKLLQNSKNGCSSGRNIGIRAAKNDYILMLDSDQFVLHERWLDCYLDIMHGAGKKVGAIGWAAGFIRTNKRDTTPIVDDFPYRYMPANGLYRTNIDYLGSGGFFAKAKLLADVGMFDEVFDPTCYEDTDLSFAIRNLGLELAYSPYLNIYHIPHQTTKNSDFNHNTLLEEHEKIFLEKWGRLNSRLLKKS